MRPLGSTKDRRAIFEEEFTKLIVMTKRDKTIHYKTRLKLLRVYTLLYLTGCRVSEIINFTCKDIENIIVNKQISLDNSTKTKKPRALLFNYTGTKMLIDLDYTDCSERTSFLFYSKGSNTPMVTSVFNRLVNTHLKKVLGELYTTHSFRAGYITRIVERTGNIETARSLVGHKTIKTTMGYLKSTPKQMEDAIDKIFPSEKHHVR